MKKKQKIAKTDLSGLVPIVEAYYVARCCGTFESTIHYIRKGKAGYRIKFDKSVTLNDEQLKEIVEDAESFTEYMEFHWNGGWDWCDNENLWFLVYNISFRIPFFFKCFSILSTRKYISGRMMERIIKDMGYSW